MNIRDVSICSVCRGVSCLCLSHAVYLLLVAGTAVEGAAAVCFRLTSMITWDTLCESGRTVSEPFFFISLLQ